MTKICIPIVEKKISKILEKINESKNWPVEILEIWLGEIPKISDKKINKIALTAKSVGKKILVNCKNSDEKGNFIGSDLEKTEILKSAIKYNIDFVDVDVDFPFIKNLQKKISENNNQTRLILSTHFWEKTPQISELKKIITKMISRGAQIIKIAAMPKNLKDVAIIFLLAEILNQKKQKHICISMGKIGAISRIYAPILKSEITFAPFKNYDKSAPGQINFENLREFWRILQF